MGEAAAKAAKKVVKRMVENCMLTVCFRDSVYETRCKSDARSSKLYIDGEDDG